MTYSKPHPAACAQSIRTQMIYASRLAGRPPGEILTNIAAEVVTHCGRTLE